MCQALLTRRVTKCLLWGAVLSAPQKFKQSRWARGARARQSRVTGRRGSGGAHSTYTSCSAPFSSSTDVNARIELSPSWLWSSESRRSCSKLPGGRQVGKSSRWRQGGVGEWHSRRWRGSSTP
eukprot:3342481-Prymnesium_polylepis.1